MSALSRNNGKASDLTRLCPFKSEFLERKSQGSPHIPWESVQSSQGRLIETTGEQRSPSCVKMAACYLGLWTSWSCFFEALRIENQMSLGASQSLLWWPSRGASCKDTRLNWPKRCHLSSRSLESRCHSGKSVFLFLSCSAQSAIPSCLGDSFVLTRENGANIWQDTCPVPHCGPSQAQNFLVNFEPFAQH